MQTPLEIKRIDGDGLAIIWQDGQRHVLGCRFLRESCPCATCREGRGDTSHSKPLGSPPAKKKAFSIVESSLEEELLLTRIWAVGQYALGIAWGDGHDTGIYTFDYLRSLGERAAELVSAQQRA